MKSQSWVDMDTKMDVLWFYWRDNALNEVHLSSLCLRTFKLRLTGGIFHGMSSHLISFDSSFNVLSNIFWVVCHVVKHLTTNCWKSSNQRGDSGMSLTLNSITSLIFIKFKLYVHHSIALKVLYQTSFESNSIRQGVRPQTPDEQPRARKMALAPAITLP